MSHTAQHRSPTQNATIRMSRHALERVSQRLVGAEADTVISNVQKAVRTHGTRSIAIIAHDLGAQRGAAWGQKSNGDLVVVVIKGGRVVTVFLRRSTQSFSCEQTTTDLLVDMTGRVFTGVRRAKVQTGPSMRTKVGNRNGRRVVRRVEEPRNIFA